MYPLMQFPKLRVRVVFRQRTEKSPELLYVSTPTACFFSVSLFHGQEIISAAARVTDWSCILVVNISCLLWPVSICQSASYANQPHTEQREQ